MLSAYPSYVNLLNDCFTGIIPGWKIPKFKREMGASQIGLKIDFFGGHQLAISTGAACSGGAETPSHVLTAMGLPQEIIEGMLRIGVGKFTTLEEVERAGEIISSAVALTRQALY